MCASSSQRYLSISVTNLAKSAQNGTTIVLQVVLQVVII
jgi:hypothetical protein